MRGILKYNEIQLSVGFEKKPILDIIKYKWEYFIINFDDLFDKRLFQSINPKSIIVQRTTEEGKIIIESFEILKINEIIPLKDFEVMIEFEICYLMN